MPRFVFVAASLCSPDKTLRFSCDEPINSGAPAAPSRKAHNDLFINVCRDEILLTFITVSTKDYVGPP